MSQSAAKESVAAPSAKWVEDVQESKIAKSRVDWLDFVFLAVLYAAVVFIFRSWPDAMDVYEKGILAITPLCLVWLGWLWRPLRRLIIVVSLVALFAIWLYDGNLANAQQKFLLKYLISSQSAILWMSALFFMATVLYWISYFSPRLDWMGTVFTWAAVALGFIGLLVRWREGHLIAADMGHIPVSNLYEVFVLFCLLTSLFYLYYEQRYKTRALGGFVLLVISSAVIFLMWYTFERDAATITPLNNALNSWWMKLHVPANFVGYGTFALSAMVGFAYLVKHHANTTSWVPMIPVLLVGAALVAEALIFSDRGKVSVFWVVYFGVSIILVGLILMMRKRIAEKLPSFEVLDDIMYRAIAVGFAFFTVATVLGAFWAADAWGTYWQWDPKETWALVVWLNYASWLHLRLMKGMRGLVAAYWALAGLVITTFAFIGVNIFLSGLHSYGAL